MKNPYLIEGPALISFSGGRTSGFLLHSVLEAGLQQDVHIVPLLQNKLAKWTGAPITYPQEGRSRDSAWWTISPHHVTESPSTTLSTWLRYQALRCVSAPRK